MVMMGLFFGAIVVALALISLLCGVVCVTATKYAYTYGGQEQGGKTNMYA
jgi:hypothetical protein